METYETVVRLGGYTPAAKELGVTRAMVSKRILELERILNVKLLNRTTQKIGTTAAGIDYYNSCVSVLADVRTIEERLMARRRDVRGELRVLSSKTIGEIILAPVLARFCSENPGIRPNLVLRDSASDEHDLISRGFDLAVRPQQVNIASLVAKPIVALPRILVAAPTYLERNGTPASPADLAGHNCLAPNGDSSYEWRFGGPNGRVEVRVSGTFKSRSVSFIKEAAVCGLGIALLGEYFVEAEIKTGRLVRLLDRYTLPERILHVLYQKDRYQPLRARLLIDYLSQSLSHGNADKSEAR